MVLWLSPPIKLKMSLNTITLTHTDGFSIATCVDNQMRFIQLQWYEHKPENI
jgi:hypothetical protein